VRRALLVALGAAAALGLARPAAADVTVDFLGPARAISHSSSASRDTALPQLQIGPHRVLTGGADVALLSIAAGGVTWRLGFFGLLELESDGTTTSYLPFPQADIHYWRGHYGYSVAASLDDLARRWCDRCALEATLSARHESEHYTGPNDGGGATDYADRPIIGDFVMVDAAVRRPIGDVDLIARIQERVFLPGRSSYAQSPGADLDVRWRRWPRLHPFASAFAEWAQGTMGYPDTYLVRGMAGAIVPSGRGDLYLYLSADVGHRKGLAAYTEERTLGGGVRIAFW